MTDHQQYVINIIRGTYYPHIDGLRAFAVLSVLFFHAFPNLCPGGFIGVDVFFVISGYLITKGLLKDLDRCEFSIGTFYVRRIRRIFPAYLAVIVFSLLVACCVYYGDNLKELSKTAFSSSFFLTNIYFAKTSGYFSPDAHNNALLNLWSLSVEEQFYIFFPLILAALYKWFPRFLKQSLWALTVTSLALSIYMVNIKGASTSAFYWLPFRAWELLGGCLIAVHFRDGFLNKRIGFAALLLLITCFFIYSESQPFPGLAAITPVICAVILLLSGHCGMAKPIMEHRLTVFIGKISYSLYLFHWPLIVFCRWIFESTIPSYMVGCIAIILSLVFSVLCWKYLETPIRLSRWKKSRYFALGAVIIAGTAALAAACAFLGRYEKKQSPIQIEQYWDGNPPPSELYPEPFWAESENRTSNSLSSLGEGNNYQYVLWGDSHAMALSPAFYTFSTECGINGLFINRKHVLMDKTYTRMYPENDKHIDDIISWLAQHPELHTIVLVNRWAVRSTGIVNESGKRTIYLRRDEKEGTAEQIFNIGLTDLCKRLVSLNKKVVIISSVPEQAVHVPSKIYKVGLLGINHITCIPKIEFDQRQESVRRTFLELEKKGLARIIWLDSAFYPNNTPRSLLLPNDVCMYVDDDHLSPSGARFILKHIYNELKDAISEHH